MLFNNSAMAAGSGGRMHGSFKPTPRPSMSRPIGGRGYHSHHNNHFSRPHGAPPIRLYRTYRPPPVIVQRNGDDLDSPVQVYSSYSGPARKRISTSEVLVFGAAGAVIASKVSEAEASRRNRGREGSGPLGPGYAVASITVALDIPDRDDPSCILTKLADRAIPSNTNTQAGLQRTISRTVLDLLRLESSIISVDSTYRHFSDFSDAEVALNRLSTHHRSKFDRETGMYIRYLLYLHSIYS
jgi:hypothetical protein